jgi:hypothetical protein
VSDAYIKVTAPEGMTRDEIWQFKGKSLESDPISAAYV